MSRGILAYIKRTTLEETSQVTGQPGTMVARWQMRSVVFLVSALALAVGEEEASIETIGETNKEELNPEASSGRLFGLGLDHFLQKKFGSGWGNPSGGFGGWGNPGGGFGGGWGNPGGGLGGGWGNPSVGFAGGWAGPGGGFDTGYGSRGSGYGLNSGYGGYSTSGYGGTGNGGRYTNYGGQGTDLGSYYTSGYGTSESYGGRSSPLLFKKFWKRG